MFASRYYLPQMILQLDTSTSPGDEIKYPHSKWFKVFVVVKHLSGNYGFIGMVCLFCQTNIKPSIDYFFLFDEELPIYMSIFHPSNNIFVHYSRQGISC